MPIVDTESTVFTQEWDILKLVTKGSNTFSFSSYGQSKTVANLSSYNFNQPPKVMATINFGGSTWWLPGSKFTVLLIKKDSLTLEYNGSSGESGTIKYWVFALELK